MEANAKCPFCGSGDTIKRGCGRRKCKSCGRTYGASSGTVMSSAKLSAEKLSLMVNMMVNDCKLKAICDVVGISTRTAYVWRMKVYSVAFELQKSVILSGVVTIDEKLIPVNKGIAYQPQEGKKLRGNSRNQVVVACGVDEHGQRIAIVAGRGHITSTKAMLRYLWEAHRRDLAGRPRRDIEPPRLHRGARPLGGGSPLDGRGCPQGASAR